MVSTRRKRRQQQANDEEEDDVAFDIDPMVAETQLEVAESTIRAKKKKKKDDSKKRKKAKLFPLESLPTEVLTQVLLYLDDPRKIYNLSLTSKILRTTIGNEPQVIIRSIVFGGSSRPRDALADVMSLVQSHAIYVPSTFRLLRLALAKQCESGTDCAGYNLLDNRPQSLGKTENRPYGLAICDACSGCLSSTAYNYRAREIVALKFLATKPNGSSLLTHPFVEAGTGDSVGPWLLCRKVKQVLSSYRKAEDQVKILEGMRDKFVEDSVDQEYRQNILAIHSKAEEEYPSFKKARDTLNFEKARAKHDNKVAKKKASVQAVLDQLEASLKDWEFEHKDAILAGSFNSDGTYSLEENVSHAIFGTLLQAPSYASKKRIAAAAEKAKVAFPRLYTHNYLIPGRVGDDAAAATTTTTTFLQDFPQDYDTTGEFMVLGALLDFAKSSVRGGGLEGMMYRSGYNYEPFVRAICEDDVNLAAALLKLVPEYYLKQLFIDFLVKDVTPVYRRRLARLAQGIWTARHEFGYRSDKRPTNTSFAEFVAAFEESHEEHQLLSQNFMDFVKDDATASFLAETGMPNGRRNDRWIYPTIDTRGGAVELALKYRGALKEHLRHRRFPEMLAIARRAFNLGLQIYE